jgi:hypothetical protein
MQRHEIVKRSVDSLERIYSVVVALAVTIAIQKLLFDSHGNLYPWHDPATNRYILLDAIVTRLPVLLAFVFSIVPFYHGMNRHLDRIYVERAVPVKKEGYLVADFLVFFVEACLLVAFASLVAERGYAFVVLMILLTLDAAWAFGTHGIHYGAIEPSTIRWGWINAVAVAMLLIIYFSNLFSPGTARNWALCGVATLRSVVDYLLCWRFYFPGTRGDSPVTGNQANGLKE